MLLNAGVEYQEHASEYGTHWNFFVTLAALGVLQATFRIRAPQTGIAALVVATGYEVALVQLGLREWIMEAPRLTFISHNKEGICSSAGYFALFLLSSSLGYHVRKVSASGEAAMRTMGLACCSSWVLYSAAQYVLDPVSRRMVNATYILWVFATNSLLLWVLSAVSLLTHDSGFTKGNILRACNENGLLYFLVSNLLTGAVNISIRTLDQGPIISILVLICYMLTTSALPVLLDMVGVVAKFW